MHAHILSKIYTHKHEKTLKYELRNGYSKPFCISESSDNFGKISPDWLYTSLNLYCRTNDWYVVGPSNICILFACTYVIVLGIQENNTHVTFYYTNITINSQPIKMCTHTTLIGAQMCSPTVPYNTHIIRKRKEHTQINIAATNSVI